MKVKEITVHAGRTFNHPYEAYSNLRPEVTMVVELAGDDNPEECVKEIQAKAESLVEDHKQHMLRSLDQLHDAELRDREIAKLDSLIRNSQTRLDDLRKEQPSLPELSEDGNCPRCGGLIDDDHACVDCGWLT